MADNKYNSEEIPEDKIIPIEDLLTDEFLKEKTSFSDYDSFIAETGLSFESQEAFDAIDQNKLNQIIASKSDFHSLQEMLDAAWEVYISWEMNERLDSMLGH
ncbi:hypothetical protein Q5O14_05955 [Eubacteriaceae bacterium ES2]|nr:hypothetical protein Q5O14_05955 [Eubacteriaceae bacterium ES2]